MTAVQRLDDWITAIEHQIAILQQDNQTLRDRVTLLEQLPRTHAQIAHTTIRQSQELRIVQEEMPHE